MSKHAHFEKLWSMFDQAIHQQHLEAKKLIPEDKATIEQLFNWVQTIMAFNAEERGAFFAFIITRYHRKANLLHAFNLLTFQETHWLCLLPYTDQRGKTNYVSPITFLGQFDNIALLQFFVEKLGMKIPDSEPTHPLLVARLHHQPTMQRYLLTHIALYSNFTALTCAAHYADHSLLTECLANERIDINASDKAQLTALMRATCKGHWSIMTSLLTRGANPFIKNRQQKNCFHMLFMQLSDEQIEQFTQHSAVYSQALYFNVSKMRDEHGFLPIHHAIHFNRMAWVRTAFAINPKLLTIVDARERPLAFFAIERGNLALVQLLHEKSALLSNSAHFNLAKILTYCNQFEKSALLGWLLETFNIDVSLDNFFIAKMLMRTIELKKIPQIRWWFAQAAIMTSIRNYQLTDETNLASALAQAGLADLIAEFDLYGKNKALLFAADLAGLTALDHCFTTKEEDKRIHLMAYALPFLQVTEQPLIWQSFANYLEMLHFCLDFGLINLNDWCAGEPLWHHVERYCFEKNKPLPQFIYEFTPNLNAKDRHERHLFANLVRLNKTGYQRIRQLIDQFPSFKITDCDGLGSSLLQLACEEGQVELVQWCCETRGLSIIKPRKDGLNALDLALQAEQLSIATYLINRLNEHQYANALQKLSSNALEVLSLNNYCNRPPKAEEIKPTSIPALPTETIITIQPAQPIALELSHAYLMELIQQNKLSEIKQLKQPHYQNELQALFSTELPTLLQATDYRYLICYHLFRIPACEKALTSQWLPLYQAVIAQLQNDTADESRDLRLIVLFNKYSQKTNIEPFGLDLLQTTLTKAQEKIFLTLLTNPTIAAVAAEENNALLLRATELGLTECVAKLLALDAVRDNASVADNAPLLHAASAGDYQSCEMLLELDCVQIHLANNNYAMVHQASTDNEMLYRQMLAVPAVAALFAPETAQPVTALATLESMTESIHSTDTVIFYDAIVRGDYFLLARLLGQVVSINEQLIMQMTSFAVVSNQPMILQQLLSWAEPTFTQHPRYCNALVCQALRLNRQHIVGLLLTIDAVRLHLDLFDNRLLRCAIQTQSIAVAHHLLTYPSVRYAAAAMDNFALRLACLAGLTPLVAVLLTCPGVRENSSIWENYPLRVAMQQHHHEIVSLLTNRPWQAASQRFFLPAETPADYTSSDCSLNTWH